MKRLLFVIGIAVLYLGATFTPPIANADDLHSLMPFPVSVIRSILDTKTVETRVPSTKALYKIHDPSFDASFSVLEWAIKRHDLRACDGLPVHPERSQLLATCVAAVLDDAERCDAQVQTTLLYTLCRDLVAA